MLYGYGLLFLIELGMLVYCALNIITTPPSEVRNLPKLLWLLLVVLLPLVGGIAWLVAGRPVRSDSGGRPSRGTRGVQAPRDRPGRATRLSPDDDEDFLRSLRARADEQRRRAEEQRRRDEPGA